MHTYDVTLLKDLTKFSSTGNSTYSCRKKDPEDSKEITSLVKLLKIDVCNSNLIYSVAISKSFKSQGESTFSIHLDRFEQLEKLVEGKKDMYN